MERGLRRVTAVILLTLAVVVVFERWISPDGFFRNELLLRVSVAVLCVYTLLLILERQAMQERFRQVLEAFQQFSVGLRSQQAGQPQGGDVPETQRLEAAKILVAALRSPDPTVQQTARENLTRLLGVDHGADADAWEAAIASQRTKK